MDSIGTSFDEVKCAGCPALVVRAESEDGTTISVEKVPFKKGNAGLTPALFVGVPPRVTLRQGPTRWKVHQCPTDLRAFSADNFPRKVRP